MGIGKSHSADSGWGTDIMVPMAIPSFGGMLFATINTFVVLVVYVLVAERRILKRVN